MRSCPSCNHELSGNELICPNCGQQLDSIKTGEKKIVKVRVKKNDNSSTEPSTTIANLAQDQKPTIDSKGYFDTSVSTKSRNILIAIGAVILALLIILLSTSKKAGTTKTPNSSTTLSTTTSSSTTTTTVTTTSAPLISDTEYYYEKVCALDINDLQARYSSFTESTSYYYKNLPIQSEDEEWLNTSWNKDRSLNQGSIYRSVAGVLEGFSYKFNDGSNYAELVCGEPWTSRAAFEPYATNASTFISKEDSSNKLLKKLESLSCVHGTFDYSNNHYHFVIDDVEQCAKEMGITEEMLGYCFGIFAEYAADIVFDGNTCTIDRQI